MNPNYAKSNFSWCICGSLFTEQGAVEDLLQLL
jgi:hypothetical protein